MNDQEPIIRFDAIIARLLTAMTTTHFNTTCDPALKVDGSCLIA